MPRGDLGGTSKGSGVRCVAFGCGKTSADGVSLHLFPKDPSLRRQWTEFVNTKRAKWPGPSEYSALCSVHFKPECYPFRHRFEMEHMGKLPKGAKVNEDAVPTIHSMNVDAQPQGESVEANSTPECQTTPRHRMPRLEMLSPSEESTSQSSPPKKIRRGYAKRETARIIAAYEEEQASTSLNQPDQIESMAICEPEISVELEECGDQETEDLTACKVSFSCQVHLKPKQRSKHCQTRERPEKEYNKPVVKMVTRGVQTDPSVLTSKPQMQDAFQLVRPDYFDPPSKSKPPKKNVARESVSSLDEPFSSPMKDDLNDPMYEPLSSSSSDDEIPNDEQRNRHIPPEEQGKYIVFESNLLELFATCSKCASKTTGKIVYVNGSLVKIRQECKACIFVRTWFSQPYIGSKPAGNILISAGILFSGSVPSKALRMFKFMKISGISMSTFMSHQKFYLHPAIGHVWFNYQQDYVSDVNQQNRSVVLGGDGRADTPGHSAKYGSYTMLDLDEGVVVDIQLVQSNEVKSSAHMEKEGLIRSIRFFRHHTITIKSLITDRHVQIVKWVRENLTDTTHCFDIWHVAKGLKKKTVRSFKRKRLCRTWPLDKELG